MKIVKQLLIFLGFAAGVAALVLQFYNPFVSSERYFERVRGNRRATVHLFNLTKTSMGTGVIISRSGTILTAYHVATPGDAIFVVLYDKHGRMEFRTATVGIADKGAQLSLLFTRGDLPSPAIIGKSAEVREGDLIYTIGFPGAQRYPITDFGIVAQRYFMPPKIMAGPNNSLLTTNHPLPGMSGSPVFNRRGELIGIYNGWYNLSINNLNRVWGVVNPSDPLTVMIKNALASFGMPTPTANR